MNFWQRHWKKFVIGIVAIPVLILGVSFAYAKWWNDAPDKLDEDDLSDVLSDTTPDTATDKVVTTQAPGDTTAETPESGANTNTAAADSSSSTGVDGTWNITTDSVLRYRVTESINGFDTEGVGSTNQVTGALTISGTTATAADFTVDMTTFSSDESRRDGQFNGRIMSVDEFPTAEFHLTSPIDFGSVPAEGTSIKATATGDLTLRGVTKSVTFEVTAQVQNGKIGVLGNIPVLFSDYDIPNPSFGTISTQDHGLLEFVLVFEPA